jgi:MFS family permease
MSDKSASKYGGIAGLTVTEFVSISSIISAIPVIIIIGLGFLLIGWLLPESLSLLSFPLMLLVTALPLARFAIPATRGYFDQGIFNDHIERGETTAFAVRYLIANLIWMLPIGTFSWLTISTMSDTSSGYGFQLGAGGAMMLLLMIAAMIGSLLSIITTCLTEEIAELFDPSLWWGLVSEYLDHLMVFCASTIGAVFIFWLYFSIPMLLLVALAFSISDGFGSLLAGFFALLPVALAPVVLGRLAGALVYSLHFPEDQPASPTVTINPSNYTYFFW